MREDTKELINKIVRHIQNVQENCIMLGRKLIDKDQEDVGRKLIYNCFQHDVSKFLGMEWEYLTLSSSKKRLNKNDRFGLTLAVKSHTLSNLHHPEYWGDIHHMPDIYVMEMVCDWKSRSTEFGTSLIDWINKDAAERYKFTKDDEVYKKIIKYVEMLCDTPFNDLK